MADHPILADPKDFGNKPGDGPLRVGGKPGKGVEATKSERPDTLSPLAQRQVHALAIVRDMWDGTETVRAQGRSYLPQAPGEKDAPYNERLNKSVFFNAFRRTVEGLAGLVFRKDPVLGDDVPALLVQHWENIDMAGTHGDVFVRERLEDVLTAGHGAILVEFPRTDGDQTAAEEMSEIRPYWVPIRKEDILSWRTENVKGRTQLTQVVIRERSFADVGRFGAEEHTQFRVISLAQVAADKAKGVAAKAVVAWELLEIIDKRVRLMDAGTYTNQTEIPLAEIITSGRKSIFESQPPLLDLAYLNIAHYQTWSDLMTSMHKTNVPIFVTIGMEPLGTDEETGTSAPLVLGPNTYLDIANPDGKAMYVSHNGVGHETTLALLADLKSDMGTLGLAMLAPQKRTAETAEAKRLDKSTEDSALGVTARGLQDGIEQAMKYHGLYLPGTPEGGSIVINRDFEGLLMDASVMTAYAGLVQAGFPSMPVLQALQAGGRIRPDEDLDELEMVWLAGAAAKEEEAQMRADMQGAPPAVPEPDDEAA